MRSFHLKELTKHATLPLLGVKTVRLNPVPFDRFLHFTARIHIIDDHPDCFLFFVFDKCDKRTKTMKLFSTVFAFPIFCWDIPFYSHKISIMQHSQTCQTIVALSIVDRWLACCVMNLWSCALVILWILQYKLEWCEVMFVGSIYQRSCFALRILTIIDMFLFQLICSFLFSHVYVLFLAIPILISFP